MVKTKKVKRRIRYHVDSVIGDQIRGEHRWTFAVVNQLSKIDEIKSKLIRVLAPIEDMTFDAEAFDYTIKRSNGIHCKVFSLSSDKGDLEYDEKRNIYNSKDFKWDRDLRERVDGNYEGYAKRIIEFVED